MSDEVWVDPRSVAAVVHDVGVAVDHLLFAIRARPRNGRGPGGGTRPAPAKRARLRATDTHAASRRGHG
jgi:hypothetical protein